MPIRISYTGEVWDWHNRRNTIGTAEISIGDAIEKKISVDNEGGFIEAQRERINNMCEFVGTLMEIMAERQLLNNADLDRLFNTGWNSQFPDIGFMRE